VRCLLAQLLLQLCQQPPQQSMAPHGEHVVGHHLDGCSKEVKEGYAFEFRNL
jgi:hypothetical protein